jgi:hypothetical protein
MYNIDLDVYDYYDDDIKYDDCGNTTVAVLKVGRIKIPLCWDCVNELHESLTEFRKPQYCFQCKHYKKSPHYSSSGSCCKDEDVSDNNAGYVHSRDWMWKCKDFNEKEK